MTTTARGVHFLKTHPDQFQAVVSGRKRFEVRKNDRDFRTGDYLHLREYDPDTDELSGKACMVRVTHILKAVEGDYGLRPGYCAMSITMSERTPETDALQRAIDNIQHPSMAVDSAPLNKAQNREWHWDCFGCGKAFAPGMGAMDKVECPNCEMAYWPEKRSAVPTIHEMHKRRGYWRTLNGEPRQAPLMLREYDRTETPIGEN